MSDARTKKELEEVIKELSAELKKYKNVEKQLKADATELPFPAVGLHKDSKGGFHIVEVKFDPESKAAAVSGIVNLHSTDPSIASYKLKEYVIEGVFRKVQGGRYV